MSIWHLNNKRTTRLNLFRRADGTFRVIEAGEYRPLLSNGIHILIHEKYASIFEQLPGQVTLKRTIIFDQVMKTENHDYYQMDITAAISHDTIASQNGTSKKIWHDHGYLFVSTLLKDDLIKANIDDADLTFTVGYSHFGG